MCTTVILFFPILSHVVYEHARFVSIYLCYSIILSGSVPNYTNGSKCEIVPSPKGFRGSSNPPSRECRNKRGWGGVAGGARRPGEGGTVGVRSRTHGKGKCGVRSSRSAALGLMCVTLPRGTRRRLSRDTPRAAFSIVRRYIHGVVDPAYSLGWPTAEERGLPRCWRCSGRIILSG
jgi:hypothetical protein